jgi:hypothetical protein
MNTHLIGLIDMLFVSEMNDANDISNLTPWRRSSPTWPPWTSSQLLTLGQTSTTGCGRMWQLGDKTRPQKKKVRVIMRSKVARITNEGLLVSLSVKLDNQQVLKNLQRRIVHKNPARFLRRLGTAQKSISGKKALCKVIEASVLHHQVYQEELIQLQQDDMTQKMLLESKAKEVMAMLFQAKVLAEQVEMINLEEKQIRFSSHTEDTFVQMETTRNGTVKEAATALEDFEQFSQLDGADCSIDSDSEISENPTSNSFICHNCDRTYSKQSNLNRHLMYYCPHQPGVDPIELTQRRKDLLHEDFGGSQKVVSDITIYKINK